jgi:hypothetical protein
MATRGRPRKNAPRSEPSLATASGATASQAQAAEQAAVTGNVPTRPAEAGASHQPNSRPVSALREPAEGHQPGRNDAGPSTRPAPTPRPDEQGIPSYTQEELQLLTHPIVRRVMQETVNEAIALYAQTMSTGGRTQTQTHGPTAPNHPRGDAQRTTRTNIHDRLGQISHSLSRDHSRDHQRRSQTDRAPSDPQRRDRNVPERRERLERDDEASSSRSRDRRRDKHPEVRDGRAEHNNQRHELDERPRRRDPSKMTLPPPPPIKKCRNSRFTGVDASSPFSEEIVSSPYPDGFTAPKLTR